MRKVRSLPLDERMELYNQAMKLRRERGWGKVRIGKYLNLNYDSVKSWIYLRKHPDARFRIPDLSPSPELSYVIGVYCGDGYATTSFQIGLRTIDKDFAEEFARCLAKVCKRERIPISKIKGTQYTQGFCFGVKVKNQILHNFLKKPLREHNAIIERCPFEFLRGFFDSEGWIDSYKRNRTGYRIKRICIGNTNLELMKHVRDLLSRHLSITTHKITTRKYINQRDFYQMRIMRYLDVVNFHKNVGFSIKRKQKILEEMVLSGG